MKPAGRPNSARPDGRRIDGVKGGERVDQALSDRPALLGIVGIAGGEGVAADVAETRSIT